MSTPEEPLVDAFRAALEDAYSPIPELMVIEQNRCTLAFDAVRAQLQRIRLVAAEVDQRQAYFDLDLPRDEERRKIWVAPSFVSHLGICTRVVINREVPADTGRRVLVRDWIVHNTQDLIGASFSEQVWPSTERRVAPSTGPLLIKSGSDLQIYKGTTYQTPHPTRNSPENPKDTMNRRAYALALARAISERELPTSCFEKGVIKQPQGQRGP